jgi:hypothetical protein
MFPFLLRKQNEHPFICEKSQHFYSIIKVFFFFKRVQMMLNRYEWNVFFMLYFVASIIEYYEKHEIHKIKMLDEFSSFFECKRCPI